MQAKPANSPFGGGFGSPTPSAPSPFGTSQVGLLRIAALTAGKHSDQSPTGPNSGQSDLECSMMQPAFGSFGAPNAFGAASAPAFGASTPAFGAASSAGAFGSGTPAFGSPGGFGQGMPIGQ